MEANLMNQAESKKGQIRQEFERLEKQVESITALMVKVEEKYTLITLPSPPKQESDAADKTPMVLLAERLNKITEELQHIEERMNSLLIRCEL